MTNRLANENSPYLLQHAENPVDWYPWSEDAINKAARENKPIFLSIGYAACHWCHVMAHESFEDPQTARLMNENFVNIKVDREERPDLDSIYMNAVVAMTGQGGWPMSVFLTPKGEPIYGGTYFPPVRRYNLPSFREVLFAISDAWMKDQPRILEIAAQFTQQLNTSGQNAARKTDRQPLSPQDLDQVALTLAKAYDWNHGGWGNAPKFPQPMVIEFLLRRANRGDQLALDVAEHALDSMARGGMYDLIGGGFARYSTDAQWLVPHFEKMLYDNAQLARVYLHAYLVTGFVRYRQVCEATLDFILRELTDEQGGFYSSLDADSEGVEGKYYTWPLNDVLRALPDPEDGKFIAAAYGLGTAGNFEGANILYRAMNDEELAGQFGITLQQVQERLQRINRTLLSFRERRPRPGLDDKVLVAWNALALVVFAEAGRYLGREDYGEMAMRNASFIIRQLHPGVRQLRSWRRGQARHNGYLEDLAGLGLGLLALYQSNSDPHWFSWVYKLITEILENYTDPDGGFFDTRFDQQNLILRPKDVEDNATPSGSALAAHLLLKMATHTGKSEWRMMAEAMIASVWGQCQRYPTAFGEWLCAADFAAHASAEIAVIGEIRDPRTKNLIDTVWEKFRPDIVFAASGEPVPPQASPILTGRTQLHNAPTAYVCRNFTCKLPVNTPEQLREQLAELEPHPGTFG